jgi:hypothetical protein
MLPTMKKILVPLEYVLMVLALTAVWGAFTALGVMWLGGGHGVLALGQNVGGRGAAWVLIIVFAYAWAMTVFVGLLMGPRKLMAEFRGELAQFSH